jgi:glucose-1-phosphate cytidylyltransferase
MEPRHLTAVILAGGLGTRLREETEYKPKPMVEIGGKPIIWHIIKNLSTQGVSKFLICTGYKSQSIKDYFMNYKSNSSDMKIIFGQVPKIEYLTEESNNGWEVSIVYTGELTPTGGRLFKVRDFIQTDHILCVYGDGLSDISLTDLITSHENSGKVATVTAVQPVSRFGVLDIGSTGEVKSFKEKPKLDGWINAGYFIFPKEFVSALNEDSTLETEPLYNLASSGNLNAYQHSGFWQPMDTYRESSLLNELWSNGTPPWKIW